MKRARQVVFKAAISLFTGAVIALTASANPTGPQVVNGVVQLAQPDSQTLAITNTPGAVINWQEFSININEVTRFIQQGGDSAVLNRVVGIDPSRILGQLTSNGQVFLINPNGIVFGPESRIDVHGLVASTLGISDQDFVAGHFRFTNEGRTASLVNKGAIHSHGSVLLIAPDVENSGLIKSERGDVVLAAGERVLMADLDADGLIFELQAPDNEAINVGAIVAERGAAGIFAGTLKHAGSIQADRAVRDADGAVRLVASSSASVSGSISVRGKGGNRGGSVHILADEIKLSGAAVDASGEAGGGKVKIGGDFQGQGDLRTARNTTVDAATTVRADATAAGNGGEIIVWADDRTDTQALLSARGGPGGGDGGLIETSGKKSLEFSRAADVSAPAGEPGTWLLDPEDIVIDGGKASSIEDALNGGSNVSIQTSDGGDGKGDITVESSITKSEGDDAGLSLTAHNQVHVNASIRSEHNKLDVSLNAGSKVNINADIDTNGGSLSTRVTGVLETEPEIQESNDAGGAVDGATDQAGDESPATENSESPGNTEDDHPEDLEEEGDDTLVAQVDEESEPANDSEAGVDETENDEQQATDEATEQSLENNTNELVNAAESPDTSTEDIDAQPVDDDYEANINANVTTLGGDIYIDAGADGTVYVSADLDASNLSDSAAGGDITIQGDRIAVLDDATVDASGDAGGGDVLIGGDYKGENPDVRNASATYIGKDAVLRADAVSEGDGGKVIVWSDEVTKFHGTITARGGAGGGDGGLVETSGKEYLEAYGTVDASAPAGVAGTWLLDPRNIEILNAASSDGSFDAGDPNVFTPTGDDAVADRNTIEASLNIGTGVTITTGATGFQDGDITVTDSITKSMGGDAVLTLDAADDIFINNNILDTTSNDTLDLILIAGAANDTDGTSGVKVDTAPSGSNVTVEVDTLDISGGGLEIIATGNLGALVRANQITVNVDGGVEIEGSATGTGAAELEEVSGNLSIDADYLSVIAHSGDARIQSFTNPMTITTDSTIGTGSNPNASVLVKSDGAANAFISGGVQDIDASGGVEVIVESTGDSSINSDSGVNGPTPDQNINAQYVIARTVDQGNALINSLGGRQQIDASGVITTSPGDNENVSVLVESSGDGFAIITTEKFDNGNLIATGTQTISAANGGVRVSNSGSAFSQIVGNQTISTDFLDISASNGFAGLFSRVGGTQTLTIDGTKPGTDRAIDLSGTGTGIAQIGLFGDLAPQIISITGDKSTIHISSDGLGAEAWIIGDQQIHGANLGDPAGAIELIAANGGFSGLRGRGTGQTILAESLYVEGNSGGFSQVSVDVPPAGTASEAPTQNITLTGLVAGEDVGLLVRSIDDGGAQVTSRNRSDELIGQDGVNQNFVQIGLEQNITVENGGVRVITEDQDTAFDGANPNAFAQIHGGEQTLEAEFFEVIANDGGAFIGNRNNLDADGNNVGKAQTIIATGSNAAGQAILVQTNSASTAEIASFLHNVPGEPAFPAGSPAGTIGAQQTISAPNGSIRVQNTGSGDPEIRAQIYGSGQIIDAQFIEVLADGGPANIFNEANQSDPTQNPGDPARQSITTTSANNDGVGILVQASAEWDAGISSFDQLAANDFNGLAQHILVQNDAALELKNLSNDGGHANVFGGPVVIDAGPILISGGPGTDADAGVFSDSGDITLMASTVTLEAGTGPGADASVFSETGDVTIQADTVVLTGEPAGGLFNITAQTPAGPGTVTISAGDFDNPGTLTITGPGTITDPTTIVVESGVCTADGGTCPGDPRFNAPNVNFVDLNNPPAPPPPPGTDDATPPAPTATDGATPPPGDEGTGDSPSSPTLQMVTQEANDATTTDVITQVLAGQNALLDSFSTTGAYGDQDDGADDTQQPGPGAATDGTPGQVEETQQDFLCS